MDVVVLVKDVPNPAGTPLIGNARTVVTAVIERLDARRDSR